MGIHFLTFATTRLMASYYYSSVAVALCLFISVALGADVSDPPQLSKIDCGDQVFLNGGEQCLKLEYPDKSVGYASLVSEHPDDPFLNGSILTADGSIVDGTLV